MRPPQYSTAALSDLFHRQTVAALPEVMAALGTRARRTAFRKLKELPCRTSYSHRGGYYTLEEFIDFDQHGLWSFRDVRFSVAGTLLATTAAMVSDAPAGQFSEELDNLLHVGTQDVLRKLVQERKLSRRKLAGQFLYCAADRTRKAQQLSARRALLAADLMPDELRAAIVLFASLLDERQRRLYAGLESLKCGWGGDARIAGLLGIDPGTVARGRKQLLAQDVERARVRRPGGGRPPLEKNSRGDRCHRKGAAVAELVGRDRTSRQRGAGRRGCPHVLVQEVLESGAAHGPVGGVQEQLRRWVLAADGEPGPEVSGGLFPQRETALTAALAMDSEARSSAQRQICHLRRHQFGHAQSSREAEVEHAAVADAKPSGGVGSVHDRADLVHGQVADERLAGLPPRSTSKWARKAMMSGASRCSRCSCDGLMPRRSAAKMNNSRKA